MRTTGVLFLSLVLMSLLPCTVHAQPGSYCNAAIEIPGDSTHFVATGTLDADNDCSSPFAWPYNEVFYRFTPVVSGNFIFRLQTFAPSTSVALRIVSGACCIGATTVAAIHEEMVPADCDSGNATYLRAALIAGTDYWFHIGDNTNIARHSPFRFEMLLVDCPPSDSGIVHNTCATALELMPNDSIMGDSAVFPDADWYVFTLTEPNSRVTISEFGRSFGHCNTGFFPLCFTNPLNAHFLVFCTCLSTVPIAEANGELCSTDAQAELCLPAGTYYIKVQNYNGESWAGWDYILKLQSIPISTPCENPCGPCLAVDYTLPFIQCDTTVHPHTLLPRSFDLPVEVFNPCGVLCDSIVVRFIDSLTGPGGFGTVTPDSIVVGSLAPGATETVTFAFNIDPLQTDVGGCIPFRFILTSPCQTIIDSACVLVDSCREFVVVCPPPDVVDTLTRRVAPTDTSFKMAFEGCVHIGAVDITTVRVIGPASANDQLLIAGGCLTCAPDDVVDSCAFRDGPGDRWEVLSMDMVPDSSWTITLRALDDSVCCVCVHMDFRLPVELTDFGAISGDGEVTLRWVTATEQNNDHFEIARDGARVGTVPGAGTSPEQHIYHWTDQGLTNGLDYTYTLSSVDLSGARHTLGTLTAHPTGATAVITQYTLRQNYPNPFNPATEISFDLVDKGLTSLKVYNLMGQEVAVLVNSTLGVGRHVVNFNAATLPSGVYLYRLTVNNFTDQKKMLLLK